MGKILPHVKLRVNMYDKKKYYKSVNQWETTEEKTQSQPQWGEK